MARLGLYEVRLEGGGIFLQLEPSGTKENAPNKAGQRAYYNDAKHIDGEKWRWEEIEIDRNGFQEVRADGTIYFLVGFDGGANGGSSDIIKKNKN